MALNYHGSIEDSLCECCRSNDYFQLEIWTEELETLLDVRNCDECVLCQLFLSLLEADGQNDGLEPTLRQKISIRKRYGELAELKLRVNGKPIAYVMFRQQNLLVDEIFKPRPIPATLPFDPVPIREWIAVCENEHSDNCGHSNPDLSIQTHLIDPDKQCLVVANTSFRYCALSYVVGGVSGLQTLMSNRAALLEPGSLALAEYRSLLPRTIEDAMYLVASMGERYLWVDALCIIQDDPANKHTQIASMDTIYGSASLTIVAVSSSSANVGLPGVREMLRPQWYRAAEFLVSRREPLAKKQHLSAYGCPPQFSEILKRSPYERRGWTFQERILSRRCLYLTNWGYIAQCRSSFRGEMFALEGKWPDLLRIPPPKERQQSPRSINTVPFNMKSWSSHFERYARMVEDYSLRKLSFQSDRLLAFTGIVNAMQAEGPYTFLHGLPTERMDLSMSWRPVPDLSDQPRSTLRDHSLDHIPTWSWAGHGEPIAYGEIANYHFYDSGSILIINEIEWSLTEDSRFISVTAFAADASLVNISSISTSDNKCTEILDVKSNLRIGLLLDEPGVIALEKRGSCQLILLSTVTSRRLA